MLSLAVPLLVSLTSFSTAFWPAGASSPELSDEEELELVAGLLATGFSRDTLVFLVGVNDLTDSAGLFPLLLALALVVVGFAAFLSGFCTAGASSSELSDEEEEAQCVLTDFSARSSKLPWPPKMARHDEDDFWVSATKNASLAFPQGMEACKRLARIKAKSLTQTNI